MYKRQILRIMEVSRQTVPMQTGINLQPRLLAAISFHLRTDISVSYTHLDVYKRQGLRSTKVFCNLSLRLICILPQIANTLSVIQVSPPDNAG